MINRIFVSGIVFCLALTNSSVCFADPPIVDLSYNASTTKYRNNVTLSSQYCWSSLRYFVALNDNPYPDEADIPLTSLNPILWGPKTYYAEFSLSSLGSGIRHVYVKDYGFRQITSFPYLASWNATTNVVDVAY